MKIKKKKQCNVDCGCPTGIKEDHKNGKGDQIRPTKKTQYNKNYEQINWSKE